MDDVTRVAHRLVGVATGTVEGEAAFEAVCQCGWQGGSVETHRSEQAARAEHQAHLLEQARQARRRP